MFMEDSVPKTYAEPRECPNTLTCSMQKRHLLKFKAHSLFVKHILNNSNFTIPNITHLSSSNQAWNSFLILSLRQGASNCWPVAWLLPFGRLPRTDAHTKEWSWLQGHGLSIQPDWDQIPVSSASLNTGVCSVLPLMAVLSGPHASAALSKPMAHENHTDFWTPFPAALCSPFPKSQPLSTEFWPPFFCPESLWSPCGLQPLC